MDSLKQAQEKSTQKNDLYVHPCVKCGACCSFFRVIFDKDEVHPMSHHVPKEFTEKINTNERIMLGTNQVKIRCVALTGQIGQSVSCSIYENRPSCCRRFAASYENGSKNPNCDLARKAKGLKPLKPSDFPPVEIHPQLSKTL
ncbi:MAG: YkgJ family cysteine cluster protein [Bacillota bacterium]